MIYYGSSLSPNLTLTSEGYLIALNVPIARTGVQLYLPSELSIDDIESYVGKDGMVSVYRDPEEVFSPATIASFEGKPICEGHPQTASGDGVVNTANESYYRKGHMQNVRRGTGDNADNLVADLFITDTTLTNAVQSKGRREVSCGYLCDWIPEGGKIYQRNIRGNHIAVVPKGRAGSDVAIHDNAPPSAGERSKYMAKDKASLAKHIFGLGIKEFAKDAEPEELAEAVTSGETTETKEPDALGEIMKAIEGISARLTALEESDKKVHEEIPDPMETLDEAIKEEAKKEDESLEEEKKEKSESIGDDCKGKPAGDSAVEFVKRMKPIVAKMPVGVARDEAVKELMNILKDGKKSSVYGDIAKATLSHTHDSVPNKTLAENTNAFVDNCKALRNKEDK